MQMSHRVRLVLVFSLFAAASSLTVPRVGCCEEPGSETPFLSLVPNGGSYWDAPLGTHIAIHPDRNRLFTVGLQSTRRHLFHLDSVTGAIVASSTVEADSNWQCRDIEVWTRGEEVLVAWGISLGTERTQGKALERFDARTGFSKGIDSSLPFIAFEVDSINESAWGIVEGGTHYEIASLDLAGSVSQVTETAIRVPEAIVRDVILDATHSLLYALFQSTRDPVSQPHLAESGGFIIEYSLPTAIPLRQVIISKDNFRIGTMALDTRRRIIYLNPFEPGSRVYRVNAADMILEATFERSDFPFPFNTGGAVAVHPETGQVFLSNNNANDIDRRVILADLSAEAPELINSWRAGVAANRIIYDNRLRLAYAASQFSQSLTLIDSDQTAFALQAPIAASPYALTFDSAHSRLLLLTKSGVVFSIDPLQMRVTERIETFGHTPRVALNLDIPRGRVYLGTFGEVQPVVFDSGSLTQVATLDLPGSTLAVSQNDGLIFQTAYEYQSLSPINISSSTDGTLLRPVPADYRFGRTFTTVVDDTRKTLLGATNNRSAGLGRGVWYYNWVDDVSGDLVLPAPPFEGWTRFLMLDSEPVNGDIALVALSGITHYLALWNSRDDTTPYLLALQGASVLTDILMDTAGRRVLLLGSGGDPVKTLLYAVNLDGDPNVSIIPTDLAGIATAMALDESTRILWLASVTPSGLYRVPLPVPEGSGAPRFCEYSVEVNAQGASGRNRIDWRLSQQPDNRATLLLYRQDGELAAYRPLLPAGLPPSATEFLDTDVIPGIEYRYRVEIHQQDGVASGESPPAIPSIRDDATLLARPMQWLADLPRGTTATLTIVVEGVLSLLERATVNVAGTLMPDVSGLSVRTHPNVLPVPGTVQILVTADSQMMPGTYPIPIEVEFQGVTQIVWLFVRVSVPFGTKTGWVPPYPATSRKLGIHTDSVLREQSGNLLVIKGELGDIQGNARGTGVIARVDTGDANILEQTDKVSNDSYYSLSISLPELRRDTVVRARVTWMGSSTSPGGVSPILSLPVGGYSAVSGSLQDMASGPEKAVFAMGQAPIGSNQQDLNAMLADAKTTLLAEFTQEDRATLHSKSEIESAALASKEGEMLLLYAVADTTHGTISLENGESITPQELAAMINRLPVSTNTVLIIEGPKSGSFAAKSIDYRSGTTVLTSCAAGESNNRLSPWNRSFSGAFFDACRIPLSVADSFSVAGLSFLDFFIGQTQTPHLIAGTMADTKLHGRFVPALLSDLSPPEVLAFHARRQNDYSLMLQAAVADNRDSSDELKLVADIIAVDGTTVAEVVFEADNTSQFTHRANLVEPELPGFAIVLHAQDTSGNISIPLKVWVQTANTSLTFDVTGDGAVDAKDLLDLLSWSSQRRLPSLWKFTLLSEWFQSHQ